MVIRTIKYQNLTNITTGFRWFRRGWRGTVEFNLFNSSLCACIFPGRIGLPCTPSAPRIEGANRTRMDEHGRASSGEGFPLSPASPGRPRSAFALGRACWMPAGSAASVPAGPRTTRAVPVHIRPAGKRSLGRWIAGGLQVDCKCRVPSHEITNESGQGCGSGVGSTGWMVHGFRNLQEK